MPAWVAKEDKLRLRIIEEEARAEQARLVEHEKWRQWRPRSLQVTEPPPIVETPAPLIEQPIVEENLVAPIQQMEYPSAFQTPEEQWAIPETTVPRLSTTAWSPPVVTPAIAQEAPTMGKEAPPPEKPIDYTKELRPLHPFEIDKDLPLWAKTVNFIGKPFELIQEYLFDPLLAVIHAPFTRTLNTSELKIAKQQGISSYFPGGIRHKAYEEIQYAGKWAVEMLPWLIVPPIGTVGLAGAGGRGIAGALSKVGKVGTLAGRTLEYSPAGLAEKAIGGLAGAVASKLGKKVSQLVPQAIESKDPAIIKAVNAIWETKSKIPEQKVLTHELRQQQFANALDARNRISGEQGAIAAAKALGITGEKVEIQGVRSQLTQSEIDNLYNKIGNYFQSKGRFAKPADNALRVILDGGNLPYPSEIKALAEVFPDLAQNLVRKHETSFLYGISEIGNIFRTTLASGDVSFPLRQGAIMLARYPAKIPGVIGRMFKATYSDKNAELLDQAIRSRKWTSIADDLVGERGIKLDLTALPSQYSKLPIGAREESYASKWIQNVPILGSIIKGSTRAYVSAANDLRSLAWENSVGAWQKLTGKLVPNENDYSELAKFINVATGRGNLPKALRSSSVIMNATLFSPKLLFSRIQFPGMLFSPSKLVRQEAARTLVQFMGAGVSLTSLVALGVGTKVDWNVRSSDFGKIRIGDTRLDIWAGYAQWTRFLSQLATGKRKTAGGELREVNRAEVIQRFAQSKGSPLASLLYDIFRGETYIGEEVSLDTTSLQRQAYTRMMPLAVQDIIDAIDQEGLVGGAIAAPSLFGTGVVTYLSPAQKMRDQLAQEKYGMKWEQIRATPNLGLAKQLELERSSPKLLALVQQEQEDYNKTITGKSDIRNIYRNETNTVENEFKRKINLATQEYRDTGEGYTYKDKIQQVAADRRAQYDLLNKDPQFSDIVARYDELPTASDLKKLSPQDWARKEYMRMIYSDDMYDEYGNYRFDMVDDIKARFVQTFGQEMLDYVEQYQGIKEDDMPPEYKEWRTAQKVLKPYWEIRNWYVANFGIQSAESSRGQAFIAKQRKILRLSNPEIARYYDMFYKQT